MIPQNLIGQTPSVLWGRDADGAPHEWTDLEIYDYLFPSGLDADTLESHAASYFATADHNHDTTYLGIAATAADSSLLESHAASYFAVADHTHAHSAITGLTSGDDHTQYAYLAGRTGGQVLVGGTGVADGLVLRATSGVGASGSDIVFQVGDGGATEAARISHDGGFEAIQHTANTTVSTGFSHEVTVDQETYPSVIGSQTAATLQDGSASTGTDFTMATKYVATKFTASAAHAMRSFAIRVKASATLTNPTATLTGALYADDGTGTAPGALIDAGSSIRFGSLTTSYQVLQIGSISQTLTSGTIYWLVVYYSSAPTGGSIIFDGTTIADNGATSSDGSTWMGTSEALYYEIYGRTHTGVYGNSANYIGVYGNSVNYIGMRGNSTNDVGVFGYSVNYIGVYGNSINYIGVYGNSTNNIGMRGNSTNNIGVYGNSTSSFGVYGGSANSYGVYGGSTNSYAGYFSRNTSSPSGAVPVVGVLQDHASDTNTALRVTQDGTGYIQDWYNDTTLRACLTSGGNFGLGVASPTAYCHLAGSAAGAAGTASLKLSVGTLLSTPESGAVESDGTHLYWTDSTGTRKQLDN